MDCLAFYFLVYFNFFKHPPKKINGPTEIKQKSELQI